MEISGVRLNSQCKPQMLQRETKAVQDHFGSDSVTMQLYSHVPVGQSALQNLQTDVSCFSSENFSLLSYQRTITVNSVEQWLLYLLLVIVHRPMCLVLHRHRY